MGKATILSHKGNGLYNVRIEKDLTGYDINIASATARETELTNVEIPALSIEESNAAVAYGQALIARDAAIVTYNNSPKGPEDLAALAEAGQALKDATDALQLARDNLAAAVAEKDAAKAFKDSQTALKTAATDGETRDIWCADYTTTLTASTVVGIFDIANESFNTKKVGPGQPAEENTALAIIRPTVAVANNEDFSMARDGIEQRVEAARPSGAGTFWNWAVKPAWQIGKPTARIAELVAVRHSTNKGDVRVLNIDSSIRNFQTKPFGQDAGIEYGIYLDLEFEYMTCNSKAFVEGDIVVVEFVGQTEVVGGGQGPKIVGFAERPRECLNDGFNYTRYEVAGPYATIRDVGVGWAVDTSGTPVVVSGNIDVQTHGQTRTTGGKVPDPIRFNGPFRRHFGDYNDPAAGFTSNWESQWYSERVIEGRAPGNILGIGSQDDDVADEVFVIAVLDESTVPLSEATSNTVGFYRRTYLGTEGLYDETNNPNGWQKVGQKTFAEGNYEPHDTAFFFNAAGTECVHVRYRKPVAASGTFQARTTKGDNSASPALSDLTKPTLFGTECWKFTFAKDYVTAVTEEVLVENEMLDMQLTRTEDTAGNSASPQTTHTQTGTYVVAAEYLDDIVTICRYSVDFSEVWRVVNQSIGGSPWGIAGDWFYDADVDNKLVFERFAVTGTAEAQQPEENTRYLRDSTAGFIANGVQIGDEIENTTQKFGGENRKGTVSQILSDELLVTSAMLGPGEGETVPAVATQGWSAGDQFRINTSTSKTIPITVLDWHQKGTYDTLGDTTYEGVGWSGFQTSAEQGTTVWTQQNNGIMRWFQGRLGFLDPRYGTAILRVHRLDGGDPFQDTSLTYGPEPSQSFTNSTGTSFQAGVGVSGKEWEYFAVYGNFGEAGKLEWAQGVQDAAQIGPTDFEETLTNALPSTVYTTLHTVYGFYDYWGYHNPYAFHYNQSAEEIWPYEAGELGEPNANRPYNHASAMYQGQYILFKNSFTYEADRDWPIMGSWNPGWQVWRQNTITNDKYFSYLYTGTPNQWYPSTLEGLTDHDMDSDSDPPVVWGTFGPWGRNGVRSFTADMQGFTTEPLPLIPMFGNCATSDGGDVFFSGYLVEPVVYRNAEGTLVEESFIEPYGFLSGEGSNLADLTTLLGGNGNLWYPLGVSPRN